MPSTLEFRQIRKTFAGNTALESFDLAMEPGEFVSLLGPSGCGKTTALRIAAGFERPDTGAVVIDGNDVVGQPAHKRNMGMVFQSYSLFPNLDVKANVAFGLRVRSVSQAPSMTGVSARRWSGCSCRRWRTATPTSSRAASSSGSPSPGPWCSSRPCCCSTSRCRRSTPRCASNLREEIRRLQLQLGMTTLFVTHDQEEALSISDRVGRDVARRHRAAGHAARGVRVRRRPAFVARFVGRINELPGEVTA